MDRRGLLQARPFSVSRSAYNWRDEAGLEPYLARGDLYASGTQPLPFNTLFHLCAHEQMQPGALARAHRLLMIPNLLHNWLCGFQVGERTNASTTQCWDPLTSAWANDLLTLLDLPTMMLPATVEAGTPPGSLLPAWLPVIAGPFEATASGNSLMQLIGLGELQTLADVRTVARQQPPVSLSQSQRGG